MVVQYVEAPGYEDLPMGWPAVFLAGGITDCPDWQAEAVRLLRAAGDVDMVVLNPRRRVFDLADPHAHRQQVAWEFSHLRTATVIGFWFCADQTQPIALAELFAAVERGQTLAIGVDAAYPRCREIELQLHNAQKLGLVSPDLAIRSSLDDTMVDVIDAVGREPRAPASPRPA